MPFTHPGWKVRWRSSFPRRFFLRSRAGEPSLVRVDQPPMRKVIVATAIFGPYGKYPGLSGAAGTDWLHRRRHGRPSENQIFQRRLDLAILPEWALTSTTGSIEERAIPLEGPAQTALSALARKHRTYHLAGLDMVETAASGKKYANAAVLFDRNGKVAGIYRKMHPVALVGKDDLEGGVTPGGATPVFACDFGKLGVQICWDIQFDVGWQALANAGAEIVAWPSASPAKALPAARASRHRYYIVSESTLGRDNATIFEPTGLRGGAGAWIESNLSCTNSIWSFAILGWSSGLRDGEALRAKNMAPASDSITRGQRRNGPVLVERPGHPHRRHGPLHRRRGTRRSANAQSQALQNAARQK